MALFSIDGLLRLSTGTERNVVLDVWAETQDDARAYFRLFSYKEGALSFEVKDIAMDNDEKLFHKYQIRQYNDNEFEILRSQWVAERTRTEVVLVSHTYDNKKDVLYDCYALINGLISEPLPESEQYLVYSK